MGESKVIHEFSTAWGVSILNPCIVQGSTVQSICRRFEMYNLTKFKFPPGMKHCGKEEERVNKCTKMNKVQFLSSRKYIV